MTYGIKHIIYVHIMAQCIFVPSISLVKHISINYSAIFHLLSEGNH